MDRRLLLAKDSQSDVLYTAPVWVQALINKIYARILFSQFTLSALRVASAFYTVSWTYGFLYEAIFNCPWFPFVETVMKMPLTYFYIARDLMWK